MKRWIKNWDELCTYERIFRLLTLVFSAVTIVLALLVLFKVLHPWTALLGLASVQFCQAVYSWKEQREIGVFSVVAGAIVLAVMLSILYL